MAVARACAPDCLWVRWSVYTHAVTGRDVVDYDELHTERDEKGCLAQFSGG